MRSPSNRAAPGRLSLIQALTLGAMHGPAELLPISSSGHVALVPWLLHWDYERLDPELRKSFEVALHAGTAAALLITLRDEVAEALRALDARLASLIALSFAPPAVVGYALERHIEGRLGTPRSVCAGLLAGSALMVWADRSPQARGAEDAGARDAVWLGCAQACALVPGVSRSGSTITTGLFLGLRRETAARFSFLLSVPITAGAALKEMYDLFKAGGLASGEWVPFVIGIVTAGV
ncbi:MAG: undecaprenyl-diphosphate phosphatase, partial [Solirubrobacterales bacterium]|nr:undecaprenyl-diphosphate phosphatase [Solirubrobacterales bacterium]